MALTDGRQSDRPKTAGWKVIPKSCPFLSRNSRPWNHQPWNSLEVRLRKIMPTLWVGLFTVCSLFSIPTRSMAQTTVNDVHIMPREAENPKTEEVAKTVVSSKMETRVRPLKVDVSLVLVPVTITDPMNRLVTGLDKENFEVYENKQEQELRTFSSEDAPVSIGVIFDMSGSMSSKIERAREAVIEFFKTANPQDEFFLIAFADKPEEISDFTQSVDDLQGKLVYTVPKGRTALLDAIYLGISKMRQAKYPKKSLLIISDGGDNHSRYTEGEIKST